MSLSWRSFRIGVQQEREKCQFEITVQSKIAAIVSARNFSFTRAHILFIYRVLRYKGKEKKLNCLFNIIKEKKIVSAISVYYVLGCASSRETIVGDQKSINLDGHLSNLNTYCTTRYFINLFIMNPCRARTFQILSQTAFFSIYLSVYIVILYLSLSLKCT